MFGVRCSEICLSLKIRISLRLRRLILNTCYSEFQMFIIKNLDSGWILSVRSSSGDRSSVPRTFERNSEAFIHNLGLHA